MFKILKWLIRLVTLVRAPPVGAQLEEYRLFPVHDSCRQHATVGDTSKAMWPGKVGHDIGSCILRA